MEVEKNFFEITVLHWPRQEAGSKNDRVMRLEPDFRAGKFIMPKPLQVESEAQKSMRQQGQEFRIFQPQRRIDQNGNAYSINDNFIEEYRHFPFSTHDDLIDAVSRIHDMSPKPPWIDNERDCEPEVFSDGS
jgi:phage terminase large subunit-like protein